MSLVLENKIKNYIKNYKVLKPLDVQTKFSLSQSTARRYLIKLEKQGFIKRKFGEIVYNDIPIDMERMAIEMIDINQNTKKMIAKTAAELVKNYKHIYVDSGSSCFYLIEHLDRSIELYTNSIYNALRAIELGFQNINVIGGKIKNRTLSAVNPDLRHLSNLTFQACFLGVSGIDNEGNLTTSDVNEGIMKNFIAMHSDLVIVLAEKYKFGIKNFYNYTPENKNILAITDEKINKKYKNIHLIKAKDL